MIVGWARRAAVAACVLALVIAVTGYRLYVAPATDDPASGPVADAAVALGGIPEIAADAERLVRQGRARTLVLSNPYTRIGERNAVTARCDDAAARHDPRVTCFDPQPATTRGEAEEIGRLAAAHGWHRVVVVAPRFHVSRARMIVARCYRGDLVMVASQVTVPTSEWVYQFAYQTAAFGKALVKRDC